MQSGTDTIEGIFWNHQLGNEWHATELHIGMRPLTMKFLKEVFRIELNSSTGDSKQMEWIFYGLTLPCCSHFAIRKNAFKTLAKLHVISLVYMIIYHGEPYSCPLADKLPCRGTVLEFPQ